MTPVDSKSQSKPKLAWKDNCGVCGKPLVYGAASVPRRCVFCGKEFTAQIFCPEGHYICDSCHSGEALDILRTVVNVSTSRSPAEIMETFMSHPSVPMHGPEHHAMVPAAIIAAVRNAGYPVPDGAVERALTRGSKVPGGWCGLYGTCGAAVGVGVAVSVLTEATPLTGKQRSLAIEATSFALDRMLDGYPRCCKRAGRKALEAAVEFLRKKLNVNLERRDTDKCNYSDRNNECPGEACSYHK